MAEQEDKQIIMEIYKSHMATKNDEGFDAASIVLALLFLLLAYNLVTKYIFKNEMDRKLSRFSDSVIASEHPMEEIALAKRVLAAMNALFMDDVTFDPLVKAHRDNVAEEFLGYSPR